MQLTDLFTLHVASSYIECIHLYRGKLHDGNFGLSNMKRMWVEKIM